MAEPHEITRLLDRARDGDPEAVDRLIPLVYDELRALARRQRQRQGADETLNTTALVHEAYEKLARGSFADRQHFFRIAARAMREVLIGHARHHGRAKRGGGARPLPLTEAALATPAAPEHLLALDEALTRLGALDARQAEVVELRYFTGLTIPEAAEVLGLSPATVKRDWTAARAWLHAALSEAA
ncbi:MAG: ECF-type sigma factor [Bacteroidota bacterium]